jgi:hypothetical protein
MKTPYELLNTTVVNPDEESEALHVMEFAKGVVDEFIDRLRQSADIGIVYRKPMLLATFDLITFEGSRRTEDGYVGSAKKAMRGFLFPGPMEASDALEVILREEEETRVTLMVLLINLRQATHEGLSRELDQAIKQGCTRLAAILGYSAMAL